MLCTFTDNEDPTISGCPSTQTINTDSGIATGTATWTAPTASDNSGSVTLTPDYNSGDSFAIGTTTVTYTATDSSGNSVSTCTFDIIVNGKIIFLFVEKSYILSPTHGQLQYSLSESSIDSLKGF